MRLLLSLLTTLVVILTGILVVAAFQLNDGLAIAATWLSAILAGAGVFTFWRDGDRSSALD